MRPDHVFEDGGKWYFWDETGTAYLGPFDTEQLAMDASSEYAKFLLTGVVSNPNLLGNNTVQWRDGEEF